MEAAVQQPLPAQAAMVKRPRDLFFENPARRPRTGLPPALIEQVLSYIYPEGCLDQGRAGVVDHMAGRLFRGFAHNHEVMVLGRQAMDVLTVSGSLGDAMFWNYRVRLRTFQNALHERFLEECLDHLVHTQWRSRAVSRDPKPADHGGKKEALPRPRVHAGAGATSTDGAVLRSPLLLLAARAGGRAQPHDQQAVAARPAFAGGQGGRGLRAQAPPRAQKPAAQGKNGRGTS